MAGWWWNSKQPANPDTTSQETPLQSPLIASSTQEEIALSARKTERSQGSKSGAARVDQLNRDEKALDELRDVFLASLNADGKGSITSPSSDSTTNGTSKQFEREDSLYPTFLSCSACFDSAYYCSSIGGQLNNIYRYGAMRSCSELWAQWRFCMRTKTMGEEERRQRVWEWNREKEARKRLGRNSEEVWGKRSRGLDDGEGGGMSKRIAEAAE